MLLFHENIYSEGASNFCKHEKEKWIRHSGIFEAEIKDRTVILLTSRTSSYENSSKGQQCKILETAVRKKLEVAFREFALRGKAEKSNKRNRLSRIIAKYHDES